MKAFHKQLKDRLEATGDFSQPMWHFMADVLEHTANEADMWTNRADDARRIPDMIDEACRFCREEAKNHEVADPVVVRLEAELEMERGRSVTLEHDVARYEAKWRDAVNENARLRGLLREAVDGRFGEGIVTQVTWSWFEMAQAALEGKPSSDGTETAPKVRTGND